jgi:hypothetical protein
MKKFLLPILLSVTVSGFAQKVSNKLSFQKGQKLEVTINMNMKTEMTMGETSGNTITTELYNIKDVGASSATLEKSIKNIRLNFSLMGQEKKFDSDNKEDMNSDMGEPLKKVIETKNEFTVDGSGKITAVKEDEVKKKKEDNSKDMMGMFMSQMNVGTAPPIAGNASLFKVLPDHEVGKGDTWTDTSSINGNRFKTVYNLKDITATDIVVDFTGDGNINSKQEMMGMSMDIKGTIKTSGTVTIDKATGLMKQKTAISTTETNSNIAGQDINSTTKMTSVTTVKTL